MQTLIVATQSSTKRDKTSSIHQAKSAFLQIYTWLVVKGIEKKPPIKTESYPVNLLIKLCGIFIIALFFRFVKCFFSNFLQVEKITSFRAKEKTPHKGAFEKWLRFWGERGVGEEDFFAKKSSSPTKSILITSSIYSLLPQRQLWRPHRRGRYRPRSCRRP